MQVKRFLHTLLVPFLLGLALLSGCSKMEDWDAAKAAPEDNLNADTEPAQIGNYSAIATLFLSGEGVYYLQVDADTRVYPANFRDLCHTTPEVPCRIVGEMTVYNRQYGAYGWYGLIDWFDFIEKGPVLAERGAGKDGVDVLADWMTSLEDGFLTLHFQTWWGFETRRHELRLVIGTNPDDPYELLLVHNANDDPKSYQADALIYFDIQPYLPEPEDPLHTTVTLKWTDDAGQIQTRSFPYAGRD